LIRPSGGLDPSDQGWIIKDEADGEQNKHQGQTGKYKSQFSAGKIQQSQAIALRIDNLTNPLAA
jgi:hypothetical protein